MMASYVILSLLLGELFLISSGKGVTFCVKPTESGSCPDRGCLKCETLQYYFDNVDETINLYDNVTLVFMSGTHDVSGDSVITVTDLHFTGNKHNVAIRGLCPDDYIHEDISTFIVENIEFVNDANYCGDIDDSIASPNAKNVFLKKCTFRNSFVPTFTRLLIAEDCVFQNVEVLVSFSTYMKSKNCTFSRSVFSISGIRDDIPLASTDFLLEDCKFHDTEWYIEEVYEPPQPWSITITGNSVISSSSGGTLGFNLFSGSNIILTLSGKITFIKNTNVYGGALRLKSSTINITAGANVTFINNRASLHGGAIYLSSSKLYVENGASLSFTNNSAGDRGGAIYITPGVTEANIASFTNNYCFIQNYKLFAVSYDINFFNNKAENGGDDIYGASLYACSIMSRSNSISGAASDPLRVCSCESPIKQKCNEDMPDFIHYKRLSKNVYPGESFTIPISLVGVDYGTTTGVVYTDIIASENSTHVKLDSNPENGLMIRDNKKCTSLNYSLSTNYTSGIDNNTITMYISAIPFISRQSRDESQTFPDICIATPDNYLEGYCFGPRLVAVFINITLLPCPPGFTLNGHCDCYLHHVVFDNCVAVNGTGLFSWSSNAWTSIYEDGILYDKHCPFDYCNNITRQLINLLNDSDTQCAFNRAGRLCGGCRENYSLAIGSSHCIQCHNNNNLALVIFFEAAGFILVFFITALNLTVSHGMVNGLIFYANIVWTYQSIFFRPHHGGHLVMAFFKAFIAWVNLDFGIETCFISGLTAFWKTWLQFIFPFYIWIIAGLIIVASKYSTRLTNLLGNRAVPVLDTLFLLSYMKLLRLVVTALEFSFLEYTDQNSTVTHSVVWSVDGNLTYFGYPHILLFLAGLATLVVLCLPYTMLLLLMQWLRRLPRCKLTNWIMRFHPVYDAYFAPLKHKHQYWFGVLLLARVILLLTFVSTFAIPQYINLLLLLVVGAILTFYVAVVQPYKSTAILLLQSISFINLNLLAGFVIVSSHSKQPKLQTCAVSLSTGVAFVQFCAIVLFNVIEIIKRRCQCPAGCCNRDRDNIQVEEDNDFVDSCDRRASGSAAINSATPLLYNTARNSDTRPTY